MSIIALWTNTVRNEGYTVLESLNDLPVSGYLVGKLLGDSVEYLLSFLLVMLLVLIYGTLVGV